MLTRGVVDNVELMDWLQNYIWPAEATHADAEFVRDGTELAIAEMIRSGVTCFLDMYFFPGETAAIVERMGVRAGISCPVIRVPTRWANGEEECLRRGAEELLDRYANSARVRPMLGPHAPYTVSDDGYLKAASEARRRKISMTTHLHETAWEAELSEVVATTTTEGGGESNKNDKNNNENNTDKPRRPFGRLRQLGVLGPDMVVAHMCHLNDEEVSQCAQLQLHVVHCPSSNMKLCSGSCPVRQLLDAGVNVCLGTDGASSNDELSIRSEMKCAAFVAKQKQHSAVALSAREIVRMATLNGARALRWDHAIGSLEVGKQADIVSVWMRNSPVHDVWSQLVYVGTNPVTHVWCSGQALLHEGHLVNVDEQSLMQRGNEWAKKIKIQKKKE